MKAKKRSLKDTKTRCTRFEGVDANGACSTTWILHPVHWQAQSAVALVATTGMAACPFSLAARAMVGAVHEPASPVTCLAS